MALADYVPVILFFLAARILIKDLSDKMRSSAKYLFIAGVMLLVALLVWANRMSWIVQPTTRFMIGLFATKVVTPTLEGVMTVKENTSQQIEAQEQEMRETANAIFTPAAAAQNRWEMATNLLHNGMTIFRGVQIGLSVVSAARAVFGLGRKRRR